MYLAIYKILDNIKTSSFKPKKLILDFIPK